MRIAILLLFLMICRNSFSQDSLADNRLCLKLSPLAILDIYSGMSPRIGVEYKLKRSLALHNELGTYFPSPNSMHHNRGFLVKVELKKYLNDKGISAGTYLSAEVFYKHQNFTLIDSVFVGSRYAKEFDVAKDVGCFTIKYGKLSVFKYNFIVDLFVGLGLRYKVATSTLTAEENNHIIANGDYGFNVGVGQAGTFLYPNIDLGVKIGYKIK